MARGSMMDGSLYDSALLKNFDPEVMVDQERIKWEVQMET